jgi:hypothetical protein
MSKRSEVISKAVKESEKIFMKTQPHMAMRDGSFPKAGKSGSAKYDNAARAVEKQVVGTRLAQFKANNKK